MAISNTDLFLQTYHGSKDIILYFEMIAQPESSKQSTLALTTSSSTNVLRSNKFKTREDFIEDMIIHFSRCQIPKDICPSERRKFIDSILNDLQVKHRFVFRQWPRPHAAIDWNNLTLPHAIIKPENSLPGKMASPDIQLWGSTLFDFYSVQRIAGLVNQRSMSTGSKLLRWCKANGEYEGENAVARDCIAWAEMEKDPEIVPAYNVAKLIRNLEDSALADKPTNQEANLIGTLKDSRSVDRHDDDDGGEEDEEDENRMQVESNSDTAANSIKSLGESGDKPAHKEDMMQVDTVHSHIDAKELTLPQPWPPKSVFDSTAYPEPWANPVPFSTTGPWRLNALPVLEEYIPQSRLPKKLIVHDPWNTLCARGSRSKNNLNWDERIQENPECVHTYELKLSDKLALTKRRETDDEAHAQKEIDRKQILDKFLENPHSSTTPRPFGLEIRDFYTDEVNVPMKPPIYIVLPPRPPLEKPSEAHLYLSPNYEIGKGHHSFVYLAEWELPRSSLVEERICIDCVIEDVRAILREQDGENGETRDPKWDELSGKMVLKEVKSDPVTVMMTEGGPEPREGVLNSNEYVLHEGENSKEIVYEGPYRVVHSRVQYQNLARAPYCEHLRKLESSTHPLTTKVLVSAKLSVKNDSHLVNEAENYQEFPKYFFEHWSGYNILPPIHDPTPVGALVPQFYGYYVPKEKEQESKEKNGEESDEEGRNDLVEGKSYLSPILLLEHCGVPIDANNLSIDDKQECAGLLLRLHQAMWYHGSFYQRNILRKPGPLSAPPDRRSENKKRRGGYGVDWSFRLIDFGRSEYVGDREQVYIEPLDTEHQIVRNWWAGYREIQP